MMNMNVFKTASFNWWQVGLFKLSLLCVGVAIGAYWPAFFAPYLLEILVVGLGLGLYIGYVWCKE